MSRSTSGDQGSPAAARLRAIDASAVLGHDLEIHIDSQGLREVFAMVTGAAEGWDGSEPLRLVGS
jgi:hypothetical protein